MPIFMVLFILSWLLPKTWFPAGSERSVSCSFPAGKVFRGESVRGGEAQKTPRPASRGVPEKGRTTPLYFEGLILGRFGLSSIYLFDRRKLLHICGRGKEPQNAKKRGLRPEKSGGSPARGVSRRILPWTSTVKPFCGFSVQKPANPHEY